MLSRAAYSCLFLRAVLVAAVLDPNCRPGGNFDLSIFQLQLPTGSPGHPDTIQPAQLKGCNGYQDPGRKYFFTESGDGALVMKVPGSPDNSGCVTTPNSKHCRTELRENSPRSWSPNASPNRLKATLAMFPPSGASGSVCIGQIHIDDSVSTKPVAELYYNTNGDLTLGVEQTRAGGNQIVKSVGHVNIGTTFSYEIRYESNVLSVNLNGGSFKTYGTYDLNAPPSYFKVGNYNQGESPSDIHVFAIGIQH